MPATLSAPGVYVQGAATPPAPPGSAITGFVGIAERGPLNVPQPLTGWSDYSDTFGGFVPWGFLAESVFGFFRNGGEKCWVVRAADTSRIGVTTPPGECPVVAPLATSSALFADHNGDTTVRILALDPGSWGNRMRIRVSTSARRAIRIGTLATPTTLTSVQIEVDSVVDLRPGAAIRITLPDGVTGGADYSVAPALTSVNLTTHLVDLTGQVGRVFPAGSVVYAAGFRIEAEFRGRREIFDPLSLRAGHPRYVADIINPPPLMTDYGERRARGFSSLIRVEHVLTGGNSRFRPVDGPEQTLAGGDDGFTQASNAFRDGGGIALVTISAKEDRGTAGNGLEVVARPFGTTLALPVPEGTTPLDRVIVNDIRGFQTGVAVRVGAAGAPTTETVTPNAIVPADMMLQFPAALANPHLIGDPVVVPDRFTLETGRDGEREPREVIRNLSGNTAAGSRFIRTALAAESRLLCAATPPVPFNTPIPAGADSATITLNGGADPGDMDARYYTGYENDGSHFSAPGTSPGSLAGLATLETIEEISLVTIPDVVRVAPAGLVDAEISMLRHCARLGDRFALLDPPAIRPGPVVEGRPTPPALTTEAWIAGLSTAEATLRTFGAAFHPWVRGLYDGSDTLTPPSGAVAGLIARTDRASGVNRAPANDQLKGAFALDPAVDRERHGELNPLGVNCVIKLEDGEMRLMGARTLSDEPAARYVSLRRTILSLRKTLAQRMRWAVFEPVNDALFQRLEGTLTGFLQALLARGVTASQRPADAFYVRCNRDLNPADQVALGIVVAEIGVALLAPAEFIVLTVRRTPDVVQLIEEDV